MKGEAEEQNHVINVRSLMLYTTTKYRIISKGEEKTCSIFLQREFL